MKIQILRADKIKPYLLNNKIHTPEQLEGIRGSIKLFGFVKPLIVDEDNILLAGHGAFEAGKLEGMLEFPVIIKTGLTDAQKRSFRIADNKLADLAKYDYEKIAAEVAHLIEFDFDIKTLGMSDLEIENILKDVPSFLPEVSRAPAIVKEHIRNVEPTKVKKGRVLIAGDTVTLGGLSLSVDDTDAGALADWLVERWESKTGMVAIMKNGITYKELKNARN